MTDIRVKEDKIGIGLIGTGFARTSQAPAFKACEGAELTAVCSGSYDNAVRTAEEFKIKNVCRDYNQLLSLDDVQLVIISAPPHLHYPITMAALDAGKHVVCEKPMAMNAREAREMVDRSHSLSNRLTIIDHELRFNPTWRRLKELVAAEYIGEIYHVSITIASGFRHSAQRPWNWWSQKSKGGGLMGALGSHAIDAFRWIFGDINAVCGVIDTVITERKDPVSGQMLPNETDDYTSFLLKYTNHNGRTSHGSIRLSALYASGGKNNITVVGSNGTLVMDGDETLLGAIGYNRQFEDLSLVDRARENSVIPDNIWARSFYHMAREIVQALREGRTEIAQAASFQDGLMCQEIIDAVRRSNEEQRWIHVGD